MLIRFDKGSGRENNSTAVSNTFASNNRIEYRANDGDGSHAVYNGFVLDRTDRRFRTSYRSESENNIGYADAGVEYDLRGGDRYLAVSTRRTDRDHVVWAYPGYWVFRQNYGPTGGYGVPRPDIGAWNVVSRSNDTETLELDGAAAFRAVGVDPPANAVYHSAWVRMRVDTDRGVLLGGRARLNATSPDSDFDPDVSVRYDVKTGPDVIARRPADLGPRTPGQWLRKLFGY